MIDKSKVRQERCKRHGACAEASNTITGLYFDGRKDNTITPIKECDGKFNRKIITEQQISIIAEPGSTYFGHIHQLQNQAKLSRLS